MKRTRYQYGAIIAMCFAVISGVWAAPDGTKKPLDAQARQELRDEILSLQMQMVSLREACAGEAQMAALGARLSGLGARLNEEGGRDPEGGLDQGGENCQTATAITTFPYCDTGTTAGYQNDYTPPCYSGGAAPDVVYRFSTTTTLVADVSLCGSSFNTILHIWAGCPDGGPSEPITLCCNDDSPTCAPQSCCNNLTFLPGFTYYIIVDGAPGQSGNYVLSLNPPALGCTPQCAGCVSCPPGATIETEPCPGSYPDPNGGCYSWPFAYNSIHCGERWCATSENSTSFLDHDAWYFTLSQRDSIRLCFYAEFGFTVTGYQYYGGG